MEKTFLIGITEILYRQVEVKASSSDEAIDLVTKRYEEADIVLGGDDFSEFDMQVISEKE